MDAQRFDAMTRQLSRRGIVALPGAGLAAARPTVACSLSPTSAREVGGEGTRTKNAKNANVRGWGTLAL